MEKEEIVKRAQRAFQIAKAVEKKPLPFQSTTGKRPEYYPLYSTQVQNMEDIRVHAEKGVFPAKLFAYKSPNQTDQEAQYIENNYKQTTLPVFVDYQSTVGRAFHDANWSISYGTDKTNYTTAGKTFQSYVEGGIKTYTSIENFVKSIIPSIKAVDAMGVIAVKPHKLPIVLNSEGEKVISDTDLLESIPYYYKSSQIVDYEDDEFYLIETSERSMVTHQTNTLQPLGKVYEYYDKENIYKISQTGKYIDGNFDVELYLNHNEGKVPVKRLMGIPVYVDGKILWQSPFLYAVDNLDLVAMNASSLQISISKCVFPYAILLGDECEFEDPSTGSKCNDGQILNLENNTFKTCGVCHGSGLKSRMSVTGQMILRPADRSSEGDLKANQKAIEFVAPDTQVLEFLEKNIERNKKAARQILHLKDNSETTNFSADNKTATGSNNDQKALYAFVKTVSDQTFELYEFILDTIGHQRYGADYVKGSIVYPQSFDFLTDQDYLTQIAEAAKAGLPPFVLHTIVYKYLKALFFTEKKTADAFNLIIDTDRLITLSNDDIALKVSKGTVDIWEEILHTSAINFVNELILENPKFFEQDFIKQKEQLIELAKKKASEIKPVVDIVKDILA